jgi:hypothetical protein
MSNPVQILSRRSSNLESRQSREAGDMPITMWIASLLLLVMLWSSDSSQHWNHWGYKHLVIGMAVLLLLALFPGFFMVA